jgi:hypothetical protein
VLPLIGGTTACPGAVLKKGTLLYRVNGSAMTRQLRDPWALGFGETMTVLAVVEVRPALSVAT